MKSLRLLAIVLLACAATASAALACDAHKNSATSASTVSATKVTSNIPSVPATGGCSAEAIKFTTASTGARTSKGAAGCTPEMAAQCTPAMRAACESNAAVAAAMGCNMKGATSASVVSHEKGMKDACQAHGNSASAAAAPAAGKCDMKGAAMASGASCTAAASASASGKANHSMDHCAATKGAGVSATAAGMKCAAHMSAVAHDCSACEDWADCEQEVRSLGAKAQVVSLKNGAMIVYTADSPASVKALQSVVSKRNEKMLTALSAGGELKLCDECKQLRGAMASGKLHREVVNVERGCMTLMTSGDRGVVQKIRAMTGQPVAMR